ncbi:hypothetical protein [Bacillus subtilis]|nr:hypothetical protein [Bacillus subtilis]
MKKEMGEVESKVIGVGEMVVDKIEGGLEKSGEMIGDFSEWFENV